MKNIRLFTHIQQFWHSCAVKRVRLQFLRLASLRWWTKRSWKFRVQFIIGLTALFLLLFSLAAWFTYENELAKISNRFLRLQIFGPQEIFYSVNSGKKTGKGGEELAETSNFCQFHIETRMPYGRALPNTRIKATFLTLDGTPFWVLSDETGTDGTFQLPIPDMPMPEHVVLQIHAEDGPRSADFSAFLKTEPFQSVSDSVHDSLTDSVSGTRSGTRSGIHSDIHSDSVKDSVPDTVTDSSSSSVNGSALFSASEQESDFIFDDTPLESVVGEIMVSSPQNQTFSSRSTSITLAERILSTPSVQMSVSAESNTRRPVFLGVWQENHLLTCRPFVAGNQARKVSLNLPETVSGMLSVLLIDASISPPRVLQHELVYRLPTYEPTLAVAQLHFLQNFASRMNTPEFRAEKQRIEYLPQNLENPTDENGFPTINPTDTELSRNGAFQKDHTRKDHTRKDHTRKDHTRKDHTRNVLSTELAQTMESTPSQLTPAQVSAASRLLGSALSPKIASLHRYHLPELSALNQVFGQLNHCIQIPKPNSGTVTEKVTETGGNTDTETVTEVVTETEALKSLFRQALRYESWILNQNIASPTAHHVYSDGLPIVYDGLLALEKTYQNEIQNFRTNTRIQLGSISCMILCCALCLVFIMLLMSILGLPTDWRIWILTLGVVLFAFLLAWLIANQSDIDRNHANIRYAIFTGTPPTEIPEVH